MSHLRNIAELLPTNVISESSADNLCKQFGPRSGPLRSKLFVKSSALIFIDTSIGIAEISLLQTVSLQYATFNELDC